MDQPLLVDILKNVQVLQCGNVFCFGSGEKQLRGGVIFFLKVYLKVHAKKVKKTMILFHNRKASDGEAGAAVKGPSGLTTV